MVKETKEERIARAIKCANGVVARRHMCAGCFDDFYCEISQRWRQAYPDNLLDKVVLLIATDGASYYNN